MKRKAAIIAVLLLSLALSPAQGARKKAPSGDDLGTLEDYVADLQKNPKNEALRIKIINLVLDMKRPPAIPEEARRHYVTGKTYLGDAKRAEDFAAAVEEFKKALLVAPWWPEAYLDLARALKGADRYDEAASALKLFIATNPRGDLARKAQDEIYILEAKKGKAAQGFSPDIDFKAWLAKLNGSKWLADPRYVGSPGLGIPYFELQGDVLSFWIQDLHSGLRKGASVNLQSRNFVALERYYEISQDGNVITRKDDAMTFEMKR